jgi:4-hydroxy-4-methyl-2-oxoglutarate aldolase
VSHRAQGDDAPTRARLERLSSSGVGDASGKHRIVDGGIRRLAGSGTFAGRAVTARCAEGSVSAVLRALAECGPGSVLVAHGPGEWAYFGELTGADAARSGATAIVVDGFVRDLERLGTIGLHVFARGLTPRGATPPGGGEVNVSVRIGEVEVRPGDWLVGDVDGIAVLAPDEIEEVTARGEEIAAAESACFERVLGGESLLEQPYQDGRRLADHVRQDG